ncbi:50S ribosomal protein L13 [Candidatus Curtissbacteria bacterium RIFCSPHIGHO2_12_41_11]|uniref:Large ribosomal subunit protein uL13 n=4 Tax=Candidatus Curtissiibacteriota TaxID=1752717 RepID=A0A1F5HRS2_9BACT|nr:MAG: 50S ribosomal protein L13 [Candidatus Curtissbacteria bacterium GW2011_GWA2_41_24]OGD98719.1 MAG: 50S ribosomal protein L13 [Candidatus Curtissbacteria bacterium RIFCSPHIGHO2_12_41_11]OGE06669.1 MAG: 50S ribosomal protein L13 [Candidatus Curtissbacteria bacterium RIFCSPLOWO2_02_41_11]
MRNIKAKDINRKWHLIDAKNKVLGRLTSEIAKILMGKNKSYFTPNLDTGDFVVVVNAKDVMLSGKKENQKNYYRHSGYPGGMRISTAAQVRVKKPEDLVKHAVVGMLPKTKLGKLMVKKLFVFPEAEHSYKDKFKS